MEKAHKEMVQVLCEARALLALPENNFFWSSWENPSAALAELDRLIATLEAGQLPERLTLAVLFAPTGNIQEVSLSSGWAEEFLTLAARFDAVAEQLYS
jgi:hypothetical protein